MGQLEVGAGMGRRLRAEGLACKWRGPGGTSAGHPGQRPLTGPVARLPPRSSTFVRHSHRGPTQPTGCAVAREDFWASFVGYLRLSASPADTFSDVVVVPGKYQRQLPAEVTVTLVVSFPASPVVTVLTVL